MEFFDQRSGSCLTDLATKIGRLAADLAFDVVECSDALDSFGCDRRAVGYLDVVELAPNVSLIQSSG